MRLKKFLFLLCLVFFYSELAAQQAVKFSQNMFADMAVNPGYIALGTDITATNIYRQQWAGLKDAEGIAVAPETNLISLYAPVRFLKGGLGINIMKDQISFFQDVAVNIAYAYKHKLSQGEIGFGAQISIVNRNIDFGKMILAETDNLLSLLNGENSYLLTDMGIGAFYKIPKLYYIGFSIVNLLEGKKNSFVKGSMDKPVLDRTFYISGGYEIPVPGNPVLRLHPSILIKSNLVNTQISLSSLLTYNNKYWGGVSYNVQSADAFAILLGLQYKNFKIGYAYDLPLSAINISGSHEIMVAYSFNVEFMKNREAYRNTRFL